MAGRAETTFLGRKLLLATTVVLTAIGLLCVRLWYLQCVYGAYFRDLSENNRIRTIRTIPPRGTIYDREERVLVRNRPAFDIALMVEDVPDIPETLRQLAEVTNRDAQQLQKQFQSRSRGRPFEPQVVMSDVTREELARIKVSSYKLPGVIVRAVPTRAYPNDTLAAQILGYTREITKQQLESLADKDYKNGDLIGQTGIEKQWEEYLRGTAGYIQVEVDARGNRRGELGIVDDQSGDDMVLTIDLDLQAAAEKAFEGRRGAAVVLDPKSGEVLALLSSPSFNANIFSGKMVAQDWEQVATDRNKPLSNRAIGSKYPPGSTFKLFTAMAGLAAKKITPNTEVHCPGYYMFAGRPYRCHKRSGHGSVNLLRAITMSCNVYFYQLGQQLTISGINRYLTMFGFGQVSGIDIPGEDPGILPSEEWKKRVLGDRWYPGDTMPVSIGQGYVVVTPIQMAVAVSALANGGTVYRPFLVKKIIDHRTGEVTVREPAVVRQVDPDEVSPEVIRTVREFSVNVVNDKRGTGKRAALPGVTVAGKTGTAQVGALGKESLGEHFKDHAWFIAFAPAEDPQIALAVIVENSGHGGEFAAPVSKQIMEVFFRKKGMLVEEPAPVPPGEEAIEPEEEERVIDDFPAEQQATVAGEVTMPPPLTPAGLGE